jgi:hypothetical protein
MVMVFTAMHLQGEPCNQPLPLPTSQFQLGTFSPLAYRAERGCWRAMGVDSLIVLRDQ